MEDILWNLEMMKKPQVWLPQSREELPQERMHKSLVPEGPGRCQRGGGQMDTRDPDRGGQSLWGGLILRLLGSLPGVLTERPPWGSDLGSDCAILVPILFQENLGFSTQSQQCPRIVPGWF